MFDPSAPHIIILLVVILLLFGARRLPGAAKSLGESMHIFKKSVQGLNPDETGQGTAANPQPTSTLPTSAPPPSIGAPQDGTQQQQLQDLQRQVADLQRQGTSGTGSQQPF
jgi:sec-independent protein translocase protein TatA